MKAPCAALFAALLLAAAPVEARQPDRAVSDTLDWRRYVPLAVGHVWEYRVSEGEPLLRRAVVGDTAAAGRRYFLVEESSYDYDYVGGGTELELWTRDTLFARYDSAGTVVTVAGPQADTLNAPGPVPFGDGTTGFFDLRTAFGDTVYVGHGEEAYYVTRGGYGERVAIGGDSVDVPALKVFHSPVWTEAYAVDIGFLGGGNLWGPRITYARLGARVYGISRTPTAVDVPFVWESLAMEVYPNPTRGRVAVVVRVPASEIVRVEVFDALGRIVWRTDARVRPAGKHVMQVDTQGWPAGVYVARAVTERGPVRSRPFVRVR